MSHIRDAVLMGDFRPRHGPSNRSNEREILDCNDFIKLKCVNYDQPNKPS